MFMDEGIKIFSGSSNPALTTAVCKYLEISLGGAKIERFPDGERPSGLRMMSAAGTALLCSQRAILLMSI